nr:hypothetical protein [Tanacetum cinerariifolium]
MGQANLDKIVERLGEGPTFGKILKSNKKSLKTKGKGKNNGKGKDKQVYIPKPKNPKRAAKEHPTKDDICHHCKEVGHWKRNCPVYLVELLKKKKQVGIASSSKWNALYDAHNEVACLILGSMTPELHRQFKNYSPYEMLQELRSMFEKQAGVESDFTRFVRNYNMHNMGKTIGELHAMLIEYEKGLPKKAETPQVMMIKSGKILKSNKKSLKTKGKGKTNGKGKDKQVYIPKPKNPKPAAKEHPTKDDICHHCKEVGHWKRNCPVYLVELLKKKKQVGIASSSSIFIIELLSFPNKS